MKKNVFERSTGWALALVFLTAAIGSAAAGSFTRGCAARDLQILKMIEQYEVAETIPAEKLSDAMFMMTHARMACFEGRVVDALALYDNVVESVSALPIFSQRQP